MRVTTFELGCHTIKIEYVAQILDEDTGKSLFGTACEKTNTIRVALFTYDVELAEDVLAHTVCHELAHLMMKLMGEERLYANEKFIDHLGGYIAQFIKTKK